MSILVEVVVVKLGQCGGGEAVVRRALLEPEHRQFFVRRSSFIVRTHASRVYFSPHFIFRRCSGSIC